MRRKHLNIVLAATIAILSTALLVGLRLDSVPHQQAIVDGERFQRGEIIHSGEEIIMAEFGGADIWMDRNTEVKLVNGQEGQETINVIQGRVVVKGDVIIQTREILINIDGTASFVHYSWEDRIEIASVEGTAVLIRDDRTEDISGQSLSTTTLKPYVDEYKIFDPQQSSASDFYEKSL